MKAAPANAAFPSLENMVVATCEAVQPPERLTVSQAAEKYRRLNNPGSYVGPWDNSVAPYLVEPMDMLTSLEHTGEVFVGPARCGKSDSFFNWLLHTAKCDPADMLFVAMTQHTARDWSQGDLRKVFRHTKALGDRVTPGRQSMNTHDIHFLSGMRLLVKWPTITELSGKTVQRVWLADYDRMPLDVDKEGSPYALAKKRTQTFGRFGMTVAESSPGWPITDPKWTPRTPHEGPPCEGIMALYNAGDRRRWYWRCFECGTAFEADFKHLVYPDSKDRVEAAEAARLKCPFCDAKYGHERKHEFNLHGRWLAEGQRWLANGEVVGTPIRSDTASFWLKGVAAAFMDWKSMVFNYLKAMDDYEATGSQEALKVTVTTDQGVPYSPKGLAMEQRLPEQLKEDRAEALADPATVPEGVRFLIATIDVQANRFVVQVHGFFPTEDNGLGDIVPIDRYEIRKSERRDEDGERYWVRPGSYLEDWKLLIKQVILKTYPLADDSGRRMQIKAVGCDSGGAGKKGSPVSTTSTAYNFWRYLRLGPGEGEETDDGWEPGLHNRFMLIKGRGVSKTAPRVQVRYPDSDRKDRHAGARGEIPVLFINSDQVKDAVYTMLDRDAPGGQIRFPDWLPDSFYSEMLAESRTAKGWENLGHARNEAWDLVCYAYAIALSRLVRIEQIQWVDPPKWAAPWDENDFVIGADEERRFASKAADRDDLESLGEALG